jgi:two-component system chemotaxis response regulator CheB
MTPAEPAIRALIVASSSRESDRLGELLGRDGDIVVLEAASTSTEAVEIVARSAPDVVILDLRPGDDGTHQAIEQIMARTPTPILLLARHERFDRDSRTVVEAFVAGAADVLPTRIGQNAEFGAEFRRAVRQIHRIKVIRHPRGNLNGAPGHNHDRHPEQRPVVAIAASTGGPAALATLLAGLAGLPAPVLIVQHLHPEFTGRLVEWMSRVSPLPVTTAEHQQIPRAGCVYVAPGQLHLRLGAGFRLELDPEPAGTHRPSADQLFESVADRAGAAAVGVLLTGIGDDGARGLLAIRRHGGQTLAQDKASCAVFGMPQAALRLGAVTGLMPLTMLPAAIQHAVRRIRT